MTHELVCPRCEHKFSVEDDYESGDCEICGLSYYWDYVLDEEDFEEIFSGYYWEKFD